MLNDIPSVKQLACKMGFPTSVYEEANKELVIGDYGEKAFNLFENGVISESHFQELMNDLKIKNR